MEGFRSTDPVVMPDEALVPPHARISPPPNQFTHRLTKPQPFHYSDAGGPPSGVLPAGSKVVLMVYDGGARCRIVDGQGRYVEIDYDSLERL
jgi:hypothetical protein